MIWSYQKLAELAGGDSSVYKEEVLKKIDERENGSLFLSENFSTLWFIIGVTGIKGISISSALDIWQALKSNGVMDAFKNNDIKGYAAHIEQNYEGELPKVWNKENIDQFFYKQILCALIETEPSLCSEILPYLEINRDFILENEPLSENQIAFLKELKEQDFFNDTNYKIKFLKNLCDNIAKTSRDFTEDEKDFLFFYLRDIITKEEKQEKLIDTIGFNDSVLSKMVASGNIADIKDSGLIQCISNRHLYVLEWARYEDDRIGFFEQTATKMLYFDANHFTVLKETCLHLTDVFEKPNGAYFALALLNSNHTKSCVEILAKLAQKGRAAEACGYLYKLLPKAKGAENFLLEILIKNFDVLEAEQKLYDRGYEEYIMRLYLQGAAAYADCGFYSESYALLKKLAYFGGLDHISILKEKFSTLANLILAQDYSYVDKITELAKRLKLYIYEENNQIYIAVDENSAKAIAAAQRKATQKPDIPLTPSIEEEIPVYEPQTITPTSSDEPIVLPSSQIREFGEGMKGFTAEENREDDANKNTMLEDDVNYLGEESITSSTINKINIEESSKEPQTDTPDTIAATPTEPSPEPIQTAETSPLPPQIDTNEQNVPNAAAETASAPEGLKIEEWSDNTTPEDKEATEEEQSRKININSILGIKPKDLDKQFEKIKEATAATIKRAEDQAALVKQKVFEKKVAESVSVGRLKQFADKINIFKKKN